MSGMHKKARAIVAARLRESGIGADFHDIPTDDGVKCTMTATRRDGSLAVSVSVQSPGDSGIVDLRVADGASLEWVSARLNAIALAVSSGWDAHAMVTA